MALALLTPQARAPAQLADPEPRAAVQALSLIGSRRHVVPRRLIAPGPRGSDWRRLMAAAAAASDHGRLRPRVSALASPRMRQLFGLAGGEQAVCFLSIGAVVDARPARPASVCSLA